MMLEDETIRLRAVEPEDAGIMWDVESDSAQWIQNSMMAPISRQMLLEYALDYDADPLRAGQLRLIIERKSDGAPVGIADLYDISAGHRHAFSAIYILPEYRRQGLAAKSLKLLEQYAYQLLDMHHLAAKIMEDNNISIKLFEKCGYKKRGVLPEWFATAGKHKALYIYSKILGITNQPA